MKLPMDAGYPTELHINEETYTIKFVSRIPVKGRGVVGLCDPGSRTIYIKKGMTKSQTFRTLIHEVLHGIENEYSIPISHKVVHQLEKAIGDFFLTNF